MTGAHKEMLLKQDNQLFCLPCARPVSTKKDQLENHFKSSKKHRLNEETWRQNKSRGNTTCEDYVLDVVTSLASAGISLEKVDDLKPLFQKWVPLYGGALPNPDACRKEWLPKLLEPHLTVLKKRMEDSLGFSVIADETTDKRKKSPINFLFKKASTTTLEKPFLGGIKFVDESSIVAENINGEVLAQFLRDLIKEYNLNPSKFDTFVTDGAAYNFTAWKSIISDPAFAHVLHIWCICHLLERVGDKIKKLSKLKDVATFVKKIRSLFGKSKGRRRAWIKFLKEKNVENAKQIARFNETRWTSWFQTVFDILQFLDYFPEFLGRLQKSVKGDKKKIDELAFYVKIKLYLIKS